MGSKLDRPRVPRAFIRDFELFLEDCNDTREGKDEIRSWVRESLTTEWRDDVMRWISESAKAIRARNNKAKGINERIRKAITGNAASGGGNE